MVGHNGGYRCQALNHTKRIRCVNCEGKHAAYERIKCVTFLNNLKERCEREGVEMEEKYREIKMRLKKMIK